MMRDGSECVKTEVSSVLGRFCPESVLCMCELSPLFYQDAQIGELSPLFYQDAQILIIYPPS